MPADFVFDRDRERRIGLPEAVLCSHKSPAQIAHAIGDALARGERRLFTRLDEAQVGALPAELVLSLDYDPLSRTGIIGSVPEPAAPRTAIVTAGTSDLPVAAEAQRTLAFAGEAAERHVDLGVAGLWRVLERREELAAMPVVIVVAGMEGALFSVLGGLIGSVVIAVPTSVGYGVAAGGRAALSTALASCAPGITVVNVDNGYGAAAAALRVLHALHRA
jgi:pyridinium-3,5-biscarboxylic acid mononucleotide synthase